MDVENTIKHRDIHLLIQQNLSWNNQIVTNEMVEHASKALIELFSLPLYCNEQSVIQESNELKKLKHNDKEMLISLQHRHLKEVFFNLYYKEEFQTLKKIFSMNAFSKKLISTLFSSFIKQNDNEEIISLLRDSTERAQFFEFIFKYKRIYLYDVFPLFCYFYKKNLFKCINCLLEKYNLDIRYFKMMYQIESSRQTPVFQSNRNNNLTNKKFHEINLIVESEQEKNKRETVLQICRKLTKYMFDGNNFKDIIIFLMELNYYEIFDNLFERDYLSNFIKLIILCRSLSGNEYELLCRLNVKGNVLQKHLFLNMDKNDFTMLKIIKVKGGIIDKLDTELIYFRKFLQYNLEIENNYEFLNTFCYLPFDYDSIVNTLEILLDENRIFRKIKRKIIAMFDYVYLRKVHFFRIFINWCIEHYGLTIKIKNCTLETFENFIKFCFKSGLYIIINNNVENANGKHVFCKDAFIEWFSEAFAFNERFKLLMNDCDPSTLNEPERKSRKRKLGIMFYFDKKIKIQ
jgi:hypothetical protein